MGQNADRIRILTQHLIESEGCVIFPYKDAVGLPTAGIGHQLEKMSWTAVSPAQIAEWFANDIAIASDIAKEFADNWDISGDYPHWWSLSPGWKNALVSVAFNVGPNLPNIAPRAMGAIHDNNLDTAAEELFSEEKGLVKGRIDGKLVKIQGLVNRRASDFALIAETDKQLVL